MALYMSPTVLGKRAHHEDHHTPDMMTASSATESFEQTSPLASWSSFKRRRALQGFVSVPSPSPFGSPPQHMHHGEGRGFSSSLGGGGGGGMAWSGALQDHSHPPPTAMSTSQVGSKRALPWGNDGEDEPVSGLQKEVEKLREEFTARLKEREEELKAVGQENVSLKQACERMQGQVQTLQGENRILKKAVGIQNHKCKEQEDELNRLRQAGQQAIDYIRRLEQANTSLRYHLQQGGGCHEFMRHEGPPDVF